MCAMKMIPSEILTCACCVLISVGCSVKEDRDSCPCRLVFDFSEIDTAVIDYADVSVAAQDGFFFTDRIDAQAFEEDYETLVPHGDVRVGAWCGADGLREGDGFLIPLGSDCPQVYIYYSKMNLIGEKRRLKVQMRKCFCRMTIMLKGDYVGSADLVLKGNVNGYGQDGSPLPGEFIYKLPSEGMERKVVVPRQNDDSLTLEISGDSQVLRRFAIGEYIAATGYDWTKPDLEDITVELDFASTQVTLTVQGWNEEYKFDVII